MRQSERALTELLVAEMQRNFPPRPEKFQRAVGLELEFPTVTRATGEAVPYDVIRRLFAGLEREGWVLYRDGGTREILAAEQELTGGRGRFGFEKDSIGTDVGYCTIETALTPENDLHALHDHWQRIRTILLPYLDAEQAAILGYGVQPVSHPGKKLLANKGRYIFFEQDSLNRFIDQRHGVDLHVFATSAANQCHIDVYREEAIAAVNALTGLAPMLTALTANAPVWRGQLDPDWIDIREIFWDKSWSNRVNQVGIPELFADYEDYINRLLEFRPLMVKRGREFIKILDSRTFGTYLANGKANFGETVKGERVPLESEPRDLFFHAGFSWWVARLAPMHGTLEVRVCAQQPQEAVLCVTALSLGIVENLDAACAMHDEHPRRVWQKLRFDALRHGMRATFADGAPIIPYVERLLEISKQGLLKRGLGEETYLEPLYERLRKQETPADEVKRVFAQGGIPALVEHTRVK